MDDLGATWLAEVETVRARKGVNVRTNAGRLNVPEAIEETTALVLMLRANAEETEVILWILR